MSLERRKTPTFEGWTGPSYNNRTDELTRLVYGYNKPSTSILWLEAQVAEPLRGKSLRGEATADESPWFWIVETGHVRIAFPWGQDTKKRDGTRSDHSIAVYTKAGTDVPTDKIDEVLNLISEIFVDRDQEAPPST